MVTLVWNNPFLVFTKQSYPFCFNVDTGRSILNVKLSVSGIDRMTAYSKKDIHGLIGDVALRKQVSPPKSTLGYCAPLALETNGKSVSVLLNISDAMAHVVRNGPFSRRAAGQDQR